MSELLLSAESGRKEGTRPSRRLRREGKVPGVVYGLDADPVAVSVEWPALRKAITTEVGLNALITLDIEGLSPEEVDSVIVKALEAEYERRSKNGTGLGNIPPLLKQYGSQITEVSA